MVPYILISDSGRKVNSFIKDYIKGNKISQNRVFEIRPLKKELSIDQIKELKKEIIYNFSSLHLYILYEFDTSSFEAQNAFLKTLEEHQKTIQFILVVKNQHKLADTVISRSKLINLKTADDLQSNHKLEQTLSQYLESFDLKILAHDSLQTKQVSSPGSLFRDIALFFRKRLVDDPKSTKIIKEVMSTGYLVENNHVDPQAGIDHVILYIRQLYQ